MHVENIESLHHEAQRLLRLMLSHLEEARENPEVLLTTARHDAMLAFDANGISHLSDTLLDELHKLTREEMVLAVVGTMKSGKSTTINAIVGTEVLPNRNRPMTALPTLIRHTQGQREPVLHFAHTAPINTLIRKLAACCDSEAERLLDDDLCELLAHIRHAPSFETRYQGADAIFQCLKNLNDLVRLSQALGIEFPFKDYAVVKHIPVIEVEFAHLAELPAGQGQLTLLDTPGPNEAGQQHLKAMLKDQLGKASAVLSVMDYTQLKSTSDEEVRQAVSVVGHDVPIYVLVNKFDQKGMRGDNVEQTQTLVAEHLMNGIVTAERVFPVSSQQAYLANRVRHEITLKGALADLDTQPWIEDFTRLAMPFCEQEDLRDTPTVLQHAERLWKSSRFSAPLTEVIQAAHANAALYALKSASNKLLRHAGEAEAYFALRAQGLVADIAMLTRNIGELESDIALLAEHQQEVETQIAQAMDNAHRDFSAAIEALTQQVTAEIDAYFREGKREEKARNETKNKKTKQKRVTQPPDRNTGSLMSTLSSLFTGTSDTEDASTPRKSIDFNPDEDRIEFDDPDEARKLLQTVHQAVNGILAEGENKIATDLEAALTRLEEGLNITLKTCLHTIEEKTQGALDEAGFSVKIAFPVLNCRAFDFSFKEGEANAIHQGEKTVTRRRRQDGFWGSVCGLFGTDDWGWESYHTTETVYTLTLSKIKSTMKKEMVALSHTVNAIVDVQIQQPIRQEMSDFFTAFSLTLEGIRANLQQSRSAQQQETQQVEALKKKLDYFLTASTHMAQDSDALQKEVACLSGEQVGA
ncbi:conserved hypothetical protein [Enterobacterales bacterium 8AC]|nr:conserved hypothetical protein [Enterobacterales bacterium 8AC]